VVFILLGMGYYGGFFAYEIKREASIQEVSPEQKLDRGDFGAIYNKVVTDLTGMTVDRSVLKICENCEIGRLAQVRKWMTSSAKLFQNVEVQFEEIPDPVLYFYNKDKELLHITVSTLQEYEIDQILEKVGFNKSAK